MDLQKTSPPFPDNEQPKDLNNPTGEAGGAGPKTEALAPQTFPTPATSSPSPVQPTSGATQGGAAPAWSTAGAATPSMPASSMHVPKSRKKGLVIGLIVVLVVLILGTGAAAAYFGVIVPNKPENVLKAALAHSFSREKAQSEHFNGDFSVTEKQSAQTFTGEFSGSATIDGVFDLSASLDLIVTKVTLDVRSTDGKNLYAKVGGLEGLPELLAASGDESAVAYAPMITGLNEQWIETNESILSQMGMGSTGFKVTQADMDKMAQAYTDHQFIVYKEKMADEKVANKDSYHYRVVIDKQQLKGFMQAVKDAKMDSIKLTQDDVDRMNDTIKDVDFSKYPLDLWISKEDKMIRQAKFAYSDAEASFTIRYTVTDYNKPVTVTKPENTKSLLEVMGDLLDGTDTSLLRELEDSGISL